MDLVRGELTKLQRATLGALVVMDVHARDVVAALAAGSVASQSDFDWQAQLRSYWVEDPAGEKGNTIMMHMMSAELEFGCAPRRALGLPGAAAADLASACLAVLCLWHAALTCSSATAMRMSVYIRSPRHIAVL